jgi:AcrR family transcriptional regulator
MFEAAIYLIVERGTHNTTLKEVGEKAGYSRGLASNRFGSKEILFAHLVKDFNEKWAAELRRFVAANDGLAAISGALDAVEFFLLNRTSQMQAMYILWFESITSYPIVRRRLAANHIAYRRDTARWISQAIAKDEVSTTVNPESFAVEFSAFIFGLVYQWLASPSSINLHTVIQHYRDNTLARLRA